MTIVPILWYRPNKDKEYFVKIRITDKKKVSYVNLNITIAKRFWYKDRITNQHPNAKRLNDLIKQTVEEVKARLTPKEEVEPVKKVVSKVNSTPKKSPNIAFPINTVGSMLQSFIDEFSANGKIGSAKKHKVILKHVVNAGLDILGLEEFEPSHINKFRSHLLSKGVDVHGRHTYEKVIKKVFNRAIEKGLRTTIHPFTGIRNKLPTPKAPRHLTVRSLHHMEEMLIYEKLRVNNETTAMTMFLFSTYSFGMRFGDVVTLRWSNIKDLVIGYNMRKTQHQLSIRLEPKHANLLKTYLPDEIYPKLYLDGQNRYNELKELGLTNTHPIINLEARYYKWKMEFVKRVMKISPEERTYENLKKREVLSETEHKEFTEAIKSRDQELLRLVRIHAHQSNEYIFPLLSETKKTLQTEYNEVSAKNALVNKELKKIAKKMNIADFSFHAARHSFANNIRDVEPDILKISRMLGHHSLSQTQDYLKRFERTDHYTSNELFIGVHDDYFLI